MFPVSHGKPIDKEELLFVGFFSPTPKGNFYWTSNGLGYLLRHPRPWNREWKLIQYVEKNGNDLWWDFCDVIDRGIWLEGAWGWTKLIWKEGENEYRKKGYHLYVKQR